MKIGTFLAFASFVVSYFGAIAIVLFSSSAPFFSKEILPFVQIWAGLWILAGLVYFLFTLIHRAIGPKEIELESNYLDQPQESKKIQKTDSEFDPVRFLKNCESLAAKMNHAWCENQMGTVRNLVSSGIYNRFRIQLKLMELQGIKNIMSDWVAGSLVLKSAEPKGLYQTIHVELSAYAKDLNVPLNTPKNEIQGLLKSSQQTNYTEIWSFVRKKGVASKEKYSLLEGNCPNCGAPISDLGELNQCKSCKSIINSGEYDWVLSEITQIEEWKPDNKKDVDLKEYAKITPLANKQVIEDRASYLFWRWIESNALDKDQPLQRDSTTHFLKQSRPKTNYIYNTAVGAVDLQNFTDLDRFHKAKVLILWSGASTASSEPVHQRHILHLSIASGTEKKSGLSENSCETCGAPLPESDSLKCEYCGDSIPPTVSDWLLDRIEVVNHH